ASSRLATPLRHPPLRLFLIYHPPRFNVCQAGGDLLAHIDVILNILERGVVGNRLQQLSDFFFGRIHHLHYTIPLRPRCCSPPPPSHPHHPHGRGHPQHHRRLRRRPIELNQIDIHHQRLR